MLRGSSKLFTREQVCGVNERSNAVSLALLSAMPTFNQQPPEADEITEKGTPGLGDQSTGGHVAKTGRITRARQKK